MRLLWLQVSRKPEDFSFSKLRGSKICAEMSSTLYGSSTRVGIFYRLERLVLHRQASLTGIGPENGKCREVKHHAKI